MTTASHRIARGIHNQARRGVGFWELVCVCPSASLIDYEQLFTISSKFNINQRANDCHFVFPLIVNSPILRSPTLSSAENCMTLSIMRLLSRICRDNARYKWIESYSRYKFCFFEDFRLDGEIGSYWVELCVFKEFGFQNSAFWRLFLFGVDLFVILIFEYFEESKVDFGRNINYLETYSNRKLK